MEVSLKDNEKILEVRGLTKTFGENRVINNLSFEVGAGEFLTVLGSSGCGKTTLLRIICGLEEADCGEIIINHRNATRLEPNKREVNTVFQSYALFPHMTVYDNVAYPLKLKHISKDEIKRRVGDALELVRMSGYEKRYPTSLSGGQRQRIAIARAVIAEPRILLLDEPLGALDLNLRRQMQAELKGIQKRLGITFIYITHDQEEALNMSDRIAVMKDGGFLQLGTPDEIYDSPSTVYTARFVGAANIIEGTYLCECDGGAEVEWCGHVMRVRTDGTKKHRGDTVHTAVRAEKIHLERLDDSHKGGIRGIVTEVSFAGGIMHLTAEVEGVYVTSVRYGLDRSIETGCEVSVEISDFSGIICTPDADALRRDGCK